MSDCFEDKIFKIMYFREQLSRGTIRLKSESEYKLAMQLIDEISSCILKHGSTEASHIVRGTADIIIDRFVDNPDIRCGSNNYNLMRR